MKHILLIAKAERACTVSISNLFWRLEKGESASLPVPGTGELFISVWPEESGRIPYCAFLRLEDGRAVESTGGVLDWGDVIEVKLRECEKTGKLFSEPRYFGSADLMINGVPAKVGLYRENGMKLDVSLKGGECYYVPIDEGESGSIGKIDVGSTKLIWIKTVCEAGESMVFFDSRGSLSEVVKGNAVSIENGYAVSVEKLSSVRGFEIRKRFEITPSGPKEIGREIGCFSAQEHIPENESETALSFIEELEYGLPDWQSRLCPELTEASDRDLLLEFFDEYVHKSAYPIECPEHTAVIGLVRKDERISRPDRFRFAFENGMISDIAEL